MLPPPNVLSLCVTCRSILTFHLASSVFSRDRAIGFSNCVAPGFSSACGGKQTPFAHYCFQENNKTSRNQNQNKTRKREQV